MRQPHLYEHLAHPDYVCQPDKALYGLKQAMSLVLSVIFKIAGTWIYSLQR